MQRQLVSTYSLINRPKLAKDDELSKVFAEAKGQIFVAYADAEGNLTDAQANYPRKVSGKCE